MHTDFAVLTGSHHTAAATPCQDYCLAGECDGKAWAVVADGCSSAGRTDLGARVFALAARAAMDAAGRQLLLTETLQERVLKSASPMLDVLEFKDGHATLGVLQAFGGQVRASIFGDGAVLLRHKDGGLTLYEVEYTNNAPFYLQYLRDPQIRDAYRATFPGQDRTVTRVRIASDGVVDESVFDVQPSHSPAWQLDLDLAVEALDLALVCTDGLGTTAGGRLAAAQEVLGVKSPTGEFLKRRVAKLARGWQKSGGMPTDDFAVAGIWLESEAQDV